MALSASSVSWRGMSIGAAVSPDFKLKTISGWEELPNLSFDSVPIGNGYGSAPTPGRSDPRVVTVTGWCFDQVKRDALLAQFWAAGFAVVGSADTEPLTITHGGLTLSADAQLLKASAAPEDGWALGRFGFTLQWRCPDPRRYGPWQMVSAPINVAMTGLAFPWTFPITFPSNPIGGQVTARNSGNARASAVITLTGPLDTPGVVCVETSKRVEFPLTLGASDVLVVDTGAGVSRLNGEFRSASGVSSLVGELSLRPGSQTLQALGTPSSGSPRLSVAFRPAYW